MNYILVPGKNLEGREEFKYHRCLKDGRVICPAKDIMMLAGVAGIEIVTEEELLALIRKDGDIIPEEQTSTRTEVMTVTEESEEPKESEDEPEGDSEKEDNVEPAKEEEE